jgi:Cu(I)/Ag(I) efflux system membrane protein CusA/SilA
MIEKIIELSIKNKFLVILGTLFIILGGTYALLRTPLDAIPDLSDVQVIIFTEYPGQAPQVVEDQVTYPLTTAMLAVPFAKVVRGYSFFGFSFVYVIFEDGTDMYWARSRVLEYLNFVSGRLPDGVNPALGPDATGVGWVYEYILESDRHDLSQLRSIQDWYLRYELTSVNGVAEVASIGGFVKQYQVIVDPNKLVAFNIPLQKIRMAIQRSNNDVGGKLVEMGETEFMVRGLGYIKNADDLYNIPLGVDQRGTPILLKNVAVVKIGPELRRGIADYNGTGEVVGGIIIMRYGGNALQVIESVKEKLKQLEAGLPEGVRIVPVYDRSGLILRAVDNLKRTLIEESIIVTLVRNAGLHHLFVSSAQCLCSDFHPAGWDFHQSNYHAKAGHQCQYYEFERYCYRYRRHGGWGYCHDRKCPQAHRKRCGQKAPLGSDPGCSQRSRTGSFLLSSDHCHQLFAGLHPGGAGRPAFQTPGLHQDLRHDGCCAAVRYHCSDPYGLFDPR